MGATFRTPGNAELDEIVRRYGNPQPILADISRNLAEESINLVREGFAEQADPSGAGWAARKSGGGSAILVRTGAMRNSWHVTASSSRGFRIASGVGYSSFHQDGTSRMPSRKMVPDGDIPAKWLSRFNSVAREILDEHLRT